MTKIDQLTNRHSLSKTLRFSLLPVGETSRFLGERLYVQNDEIRAEAAARVKKHIDEYHKLFIESVLSCFQFEDLDRYARLYFSESKDEDVKAEMVELEEEMRHSISRAFKSHPNFDKMFGKEMITELLPAFLDDDEEKMVVAAFKNFTTFFGDFHTTRKNFYAEDIPGSSVAYRCINDNLPKFMGNVKYYTFVKNSLGEEVMKQLNDDMTGLIGCEVDDVFTVEYFNNVLRQSDIDAYNTVIGGYSTEDGTKIKGLNEYIHEYNQVVGKDGQKLPRLTPLYKQILSERDVISFISEKFESDEDVYKAINEFCVPSEEDAMSLADTLNGIKALFRNIKDCDPRGVFVASRGLADVSATVFGRWNHIQSAWEAQYDETVITKKKKNTEAYLTQRKKAFKAVASLSLDQIQTLANRDADDSKRVDVAQNIAANVLAAAEEIDSAYVQAKTLFDGQHASNKKLYNDEEAVAKVKEFLDAVKALEYAIKPLLGAGDEDNRSADFYNDLVPLYEKIATVDRLYDRVRNYATQKPYSKEKILLTFDVGAFLDGWAQDFSRKSCHIVRKENEYFLMIVDQKLTEKDCETLYNDEATDKAVLYKYQFVKADNKCVPKMLIYSKRNPLTIAPAVKKHNLPIEGIREIYDKGLFKTEYAKTNPEGQREALHKLIDYFKLGFSKHESFTKFTYNWKPTEEYKNLAEFYQDALRASYRLEEQSVDMSALDKLVSEGRVYLFRFNNKDFSSHSKGTPNLHTLYFKALFDEKNLANPVLKLDGGAAMYYRKASIADEEKIVHSAFYPISNKNPDNEKKNSVFAYDIIKDRRYTQNQYFIHLPVTFNYATDKDDFSLNKTVRAMLKNAPDTYIIGIDRGERNLVYATVIDGQGRIVEQRSFNLIGNVNYHELLERREKERQQARQNWSTGESIKTLKEGYISHVVHEICNMIIKYDAIVAIEDLNSGLKKSRVKIEKQIYEKFEKMLADKLTFLAIKGRNLDECGGLLKAYQLSQGAQTLSDMRGQNGIIFYVPSWYTSNIDPVTGFVNLFRLSYTSVKDAKAFFEKFNDIRYNKDENIFEFSFNYSAFPMQTAVFKDEWTVCTNGSRVSTAKDSKTGAVKSEVVVMTEALKKLFNDFGINYTSNLKQVICDQTTKEFFERLIALFNLTMQMRNCFAGDTDNDFLISPCKNSDGVFFDSRNYKDNPAAELPASPEANDAYNIARKARWAVQVLKDTPDDLLPKVGLSISNKDWLRYAQERGW